MPDVHVLIFAAVIKPSLDMQEKLCKLILVYWEVAKFTYLKSSIGHRTIIPLAGFLVRVPV